MLDLGPKMIGPVARFGLPIGPVSGIGPRPVADLDFANSSYILGGAGYGAVGDIPGWSFARASEGRSLDGVTNFASGAPRLVSGLGILIEEARTNLFLNSSAPATQNITITAASHTITVWGPGSVEVTAGTATISNGGTVTAGSPRTIGCTVGGTITVTVTGSPTYVQVEAGAFGTSPIVTAGSAVTRAADVALITGLTIPVEYTVIMSGGRADAASIGFGAMASINDGTTNSEIYVTRNGTSSWKGYVTAAGTPREVLSSTSTASSATAGVRVRASDGAGALNGASANGSAVASIVVPSTDQLLIGKRSSITSLASAAWWNGYVRRVRIYPYAMTAAQLQGITA